MTVCPDGDDGRSLPCITCGTTTPDASFCCGLPYCDGCIQAHVCDDDAIEGRVLGPSRLPDLFKNML